MSAESDLSASLQEPTRALLLAQALETCIQAERHIPGSADRLIAHQPAWARAELRRLVALARSLDAVATSAVMSENSRVATRNRLMRRIAARDGDFTMQQTPPAGSVVSMLPLRTGHRQRRSRWVWRGGVGGLLAAALVAAATLTASASALPGEPLYSLKQAREELRIRLAPDEQTRTLALLAQASARLDETARLLDEGRTDQAAATTQQFDDVLDRATTTYVVTISPAPSEDATTIHIETQLSDQQAQLQNMLQTAPEPARADLREALVATQRSRARVADPQPVETAQGQTPNQTFSPASSSAAAAANDAVPTVAAEATPTEVPKLSPLAPIDLVARPAEPTATRHEVDDHPLESAPTVAAPTDVVTHASSSRTSPPASTRAVQPPTLADSESVVQSEEAALHAGGDPTPHTDAVAPPDRHDAPSASSNDSHVVAVSPRPPLPPSQTDTQAQVVEPPAAQPPVAQQPVPSDNHSDVATTSAHLLTTQPADHSATVAATGNPQPQPTPTPADDHQKTSAANASVGAKTESNTNNNGDGNSGSNGHGR